MSDTKKTINDLSTTQSALGSVNIMVQPKSGTNTLEKMDGALVAPKSDITALIDGTTVAKKAEKDASGNTITTTYATKTELEAEETARSDGDSLLNNRVTSNSQRIANIEDKSEPFTIEYPSSDYGKGTVPASIEKSGMSVKVNGRSRAWNQLVQNGNFASTSNWISINCSISVSGNVLTAQATANGMTQVYQMIPTNTSHKYLVLGVVKSDSTNEIMVRFGNTGGSPVASVGTSWTTLASIKQADSSNSEFNFYVPTTVGDKIYVSVGLLRDLTLIFGAGNEPTSVADALKALPDLGKYTPYGYSLPSTIVSGMKSVGVNLNDGVYEGGYYDESGVKHPASTYTCNSNPVRVKPNTEYYITLGVYICFYDINMNFILRDGTGNLQFTTPANCAYITFHQSNSGWQDDIQICLNSYPQKTVYHPYSSNSITFSEPVTLRSAGSVEDELIPESGKVTRNIAEETITVSSLYTRSGNTSVKFAVFTSAKAWPSSIFGGRVKWKHGGLSDGVDFDNTTTANVILVYSTSSHQFAISVPYNYTQSDAETLLNGEPFVYVPNESTTETLSPSPTALSVEPYGEVSLIQDQDIELDGGFSMRYIPDSPYVKKADIVDNLNSSDVSKPLSANMGRVIGATLDQHDSRIKNLEQKAGDYVEVNYRGTDAVPTGKAKYGLVKSIVGKTRTWNQVIKTQTVATTGLFNGVTFTQENGYVNANGTCSENIITQYFDRTNLSINTVGGHVYLLFGCATGGDSSKYYLEPLIGSGANYTYGRPMDFGSGVVFTAKDSNGNNGYVYGVRLVILNGVSVNADFRCYLRDLTLIFGSGNEPSTVADALAQLPALGQYNAYDAGSLVDTVVSGVESVGFNRLDLASYMSTLNISKTGDYYVATANDFANKSVATHFPVDFKPNTRYSFRVTGYVSGSLSGFRLAVKYTDGTTEELASVSSSSLATGTGTSASGKTIDYVTFTYGSGGTSNFSLKSICISEGTDTTTDLPYKTDTLSLPETVTLRSAGSVSDELDVESGVVTRNVGSVQGSSFTISKFDSYNTHQLIISAYSGMARPASNSDIANICCAYYVTLSADSMFHVVAPNGIAMATGGGIIVCDSGYDTSNPTSLANFIDFVESLIFTYELATTTTESIDPIIDNTLYTEGGGTIDTIQDQTPVIDNCLDVGYLAV